MSAPVASTENLPPPEEPTGVAAMLGNLRLVFGNRDLRRIQLAYFGSAIGDWAYATALMVYAYEQGGATLLGIWAGARLLLTAAAAPLGGAIADRMSRRTFMIVNDGIRLALVVAVAICIHLDAPVAFVLVFGTLVAVIGASFRPAQSGLIPQLSSTPAQLTATNATAEILEGIAGFVGPALGGLLIVVFDIDAVVLVNALSFLISMLLVIGVRKVDREESEESESFFKEAAGGFTVLAKDRDMVAFAGLIAVNGLLSGVLNVVLVLFAADVFGTAAGVGYLNGLIGVGTILGSGVVLGKLGKLRLGTMMIVGVLGWALTLVAIGLLPSAAMLVVALFILGMSDPLINVSFGTIPQRVVEERVMSRAFGALEAMFIASTAAGSFFVPFIVHATSLSIATVATGVVATALTLLCLTRMNHLDTRMSAPPGLALIRSISLFAPLSPVRQEALAHSLTSRVVAPGELVVAEGTTSDRFFCVESGEVEVSQGSRVLGRERPGDFFGEIGLLRDVPRTASVRAVLETTLQTLSREDFLDAVSGDQTVQGLADDIVTRRLAT